jgi:hypothetical protein
MYSMGVPIGMFVDNRGPRPAVVGGAILLGMGYLPFKVAYDNAAGSVLLMCFFSYLTGLGGCMAFAAAVKTSALNWPHHRGTATAFPLAGFGLSAFFFSLFGGVIFPGDTSNFLLLLGAGTSGMTMLGFFFLRVLPHTTYQPVPSMSDSQQLRRTSSSDEAKNHGPRGFQDAEPGMSPLTTYTTPAASTHQVTPGVAEAGVAAEPSRSQQRASGGDDYDSGIPDDDNVEAAHPPSSTDEPDADETSSLMSRSSSLPGDVLVQNSVDMDRSHRVDIRGWRLLRNVNFWQLFAIMGILAGIGLMTIK